MRNKHVTVPNHNESRPYSEPEVDYSPKVYSLRKQLLFGGKLLFIAGIILFLLWLLDKIM
jgi:flagellar biogenesis protein FliO